jgi:Lrp/AsnC family leucine-responsive transcriptional regulator
MDKLDLAILWHLDGNSRMKLSDLAKATGASAQSVGYRIDRLVKEGTLRGCIGTIDVSRLGLLLFRFYARLRSATRDNQYELVRSLVRHQNTLWVVSTSGPWDLEVVFTARNFVHFNDLLKEWRVQWASCLSAINVSMSPITYRFRRDYLIDRRRSTSELAHFGSEPRTVSLDELDSKTLGHIAINCRQSNEEIARKVGVSYHTVAARLANLQEQEVLQAYSVVLDLSKLGRRFIKALLRLEPFSEQEERSFLSFCMRHNYVVYLTEVLGEWQWEVEMEVPDYDEAYEFLGQLRKAFPKHVVDYQLLEVTDEHKHNYGPHLQPTSPRVSSKKIGAKISKAKNRAMKLV